MDNDKFVLALAHVPLKVTMCKTSTTVLVKLLQINTVEIHYPLIM